MYHTDLQLARDHFTEDTFFTQFLYFTHYVFIILTRYT